MTKAITTLDQQRAAHALAIVEDLAQQGVTKYGNYVSYVKSLPATILQIGLGQSMASLLAKSKSKDDDPYRLLYGHLESWLGRSGGVYADTETGKLISRISSEDQSSYLRAQTETIAYLVWLKKFAVALLDPPPESNPAE